MSEIEQRLGRSLLQELASPPQVVAHLIDSIYVHIVTEVSPSWLSYVDRGVSYCDTPPQVVAHLIDLTLELLGADRLLTI